MAIANYAELAAEVAEYLADDTLTARIPTMVAMAEAEFNRRLNVMEMEARAFTTATDEYSTLPPDCQSVRAIYTSGPYYTRLEQMTLQMLRDLYPSRSTGQPQVYAIADDQLVLAPIPEAAIRLEVVYTQKIPALEANETNWLLTTHPDLYLFGTLQQAEFFNWNDERLTLINNRVEAIMQQITAEGNARRRGAAPLRMRSATTP